uniref:CCHC-type domain-containing protein n=1 Tax=Polytomella parva TaxID=51329 RepID=A0A7S0UZE2_9CHLO|mmetsp:Transcript_26360/g.48362  ORF Transcript_26360/g.48362 Transcript_26360/m.48362 type:complete len:164 (+) Transcript_26360:102-593(+)
MSGFLNSVNDVLASSRSAILEFATDRVKALLNVEGLFKGEDFLQMVAWCQKYAGMGEAFYFSGAAVGGGGGERGERGVGLGRDSYGNSNSNSNSSNSNNRNNNYGSSNYNYNRPAASGRSGGNNSIRNYFRPVENGVGAGPRERTGTCYKCGQEGHWSSSCPN